MPSDIAGQLTRVRARIDAAARAAGRPPESILLVAVSKTFHTAAIREARLAGQLDFG